MNPQEIGDLTKFPKLGKILYKFVHHVPRVQLEAFAQPLTRSCLRVELTATCGFKWEDSYHGREEPFWLIVLDCNEETILYSFYFTLSKQEETFSTQFIVPLYEVMHPLYYIKVISDRWVCPDNVLPLSFRSIILPTKFSPPS
jgi:pre-mRNA-splicing helicase BRR2